MIALKEKNKNLWSKRRQKVHLNCLDSDITQQELSPQNLTERAWLSRQRVWYLPCRLTISWCNTLSSFCLHLEKRNQVINCLNKDCAQHLGLCEFSTVWISRSLKRGWAEVMAVPCLSGVLRCRIWKPEGIKEVPKNGITHLWMSVDAFIPPSVWGLSFYEHFYFTE